jgi:NAD(P)-dependent dehydrogenase (short-subunit alcohol dehydrogenase family)
MEPSSANERMRGPVLITGAGGGLGVHLADALLSRGERGMIFHCRNRRDALLSVLKEHGVDPERHVVFGDLTQEDEVRALHERTRALHGPLFGLVNLAGGSSNGMSWKLSLDEFRQVLDANLVTTFLCCREFVPEMRENARGRIVNVSSVVATAGAPGTAHYAAAKAGILGLTRTLALELAPKNVIVSAVALGYFQYGLIDSIPRAQHDAIRARIPAGRFGGAGELAGLLQFLLGESGAFSGGQIYPINGGMI